MMARSRRPKRDIRFVEPIRDRHQVDLVRDILRTLPNGKMYVTIYLIGINCGLRIGDILALRVGDVWDFQSKEPHEYYRLREQKTNKPKIFPWNRVARQAIKDWIRCLDNPRPHDYLFPSRRKPGTHVSREQVWRVIKAAARKAGVREAIGTHTLRKTFGYHAWKNGTDIRLLMDVYNHSRPTVTLRYICVSQDEQNDVYRNNTLGG